jgi:hypothetical protein
MISFPSTRQLGCHRNASRFCRNAYHKTLDDFNVSDDSDEDGMEDVVFQQEDGMPPSNDSMEYEHTLDEPGPTSRDQGSGDPLSSGPSILTDPFQQSIVAPAGQANETTDNETNENEEEVHQAPLASTPTRIEIVDHYYPGAGSVVDTKTPRFRRLYEEQHRAAPNNIHHPFDNEDEWEYGTWMNESGLHLTEMDKLLNLTYVRWFPTMVCKL